MTLPASRHLAAIPLTLALLGGCNAARRPSPDPAASGTAHPAASATLANSAAPTTVAAEPSLVPSQIFELFPEGVPGRLADAPPERTEDGRVYNVSVPTLAVFPPPAGTSNGTSVIVCPGGSYVRLAVNKEGTEVTRWLNSIGVTAFLLKYRVAPYRYPAALKDVLRAVRSVRSRAAEFGVDPNRIGVLGSSAGGHLAASAATLFDSPDGKSADTALDAISGRPDFSVLMYPVISMLDPYVHKGSREALFGKTAAVAQLNSASVELHPSATTPPAFIVHSQEDASVPVENSILYYQALLKAKIPAELHLFEKGPHGFGLKPGYGPTSEWPKRCEEWLRFRGLLEAR